MGKTKLISYLSLGLLAMLPFQNCSGGFKSASTTLSSLSSVGAPVGSDLDLPVDGLAIDTPAPTAPVAGKITIQGRAGSRWVNISAYAGSVKVAADVSPSDGAFTLEIDTKLVPNGQKITIVAFSTAAGQVGGSSKSVDLNVQVQNPTTDGPPPSSSGLPEPIKNLNYQLTFEDTFQSLNTISLGPTGSGFKWWNGTKQCCMDDSWHNDGTPSLPTYMFPNPGGQAVNPYSLLPNGGGLNIALTKQNGFWSTGILSSVDQNEQGFKQKYGYFEVRAKQPTGLGTWPAFWLVNNDPVLPGEIDIFEYYGVSGGTSYAITLHDWRNGGQNKNIPDPIAFPQTPDQRADFHTYGMLWTEQTMTFYFDGKQVWKVNTPEVMKTPYFMYLNNGMGGAWPTDQTPSRTDFQVQYVRVYQAR